MINIELIRNDPDAVRDAIKKRGDDVPIDRILELDGQRRSAIAEGDVLRAQRNDVSRQLGQMKERPPELIEEMREVGNKVKTLEDTVRDVEAEINTLLLTIPNIPRDAVPLGEDELRQRLVQFNGPSVERLILKST